MATCPSGHESASDDFCDVCGFAIGAPASAGRDFATSGAGLAATAAPATAAPAAGGECPGCGAARTGQFCEACGYDFAAGGLAPPSATRVERPVTPPPLPPPVAPPPARQPRSAESAQVKPSPAVGAAWTAVVTADRAYYDSVQATGGADSDAITFPVYCPERRFRLSGTEARVGRRSARTGIDPEIDLTGPPADPGVSRLHAVLIKATDGSWSVIDPGSANGTMVNGTEITRDQIVPLHDGDRIHLGAWTELKIVCEG
jgi:FHA domain